MFLFDFFRSFLPLHNPIGFGAADFLLFLIAALLCLFTIAWRRAGQYAAIFAERTTWCMLLLAALPVVLRLALLAGHPVPTPDIYDEFGHIFVADTLRHFRLANPPLRYPQFFETFFILQQPTYSAIYPIGQGLAMAIGWTLFGTPWAGVVLSTAGFCALCYWMLRGWTTAGWALVGGLLAVAEFGPLCEWMNTYWGGAFIALGGCLVFGALPRLSSAPRTRDAVLLALGLAINWLTRPYESLFLFLAVIVWFLPAVRIPDQLRRLGKVAPEVALILGTAFAISLFQNKAVTGSWTTMPESLSQYEYGVPASLTFQADPVPHRQLTAQQALDYRMQMGFRSHPETLITYLERLEYRVRYYRFFYFAPLYVALFAFLGCLRQYRYLWVAGTCLLFALGTNFFPAFQLHYVAACTCLFVLISVAGLQQVQRFSPAAARLILFLCAAQFLFWYTIHFYDGTNLAISMEPYETWDNLNYRNPERRIYVRNQLDAIKGDLLIFVRYYPQHVFQDEWVYNRADINSSRIIYARDLGPEENQKLIAEYPDRTVLLLEPDFRPPRITSYE